MLVPLVDFFNHRGDESAGSIGQEIFAGENARCTGCIVLLVWLSKHVS